MNQFSFGIEQSKGYVSLAASRICRLRDIIEVPTPPGLHKMNKPSASNGKMVF
jgi:hypothetical protein|tara:strand:- start:587 stop:745 length:159 start_codon:yes stop_codon:yes gene_type:complete